MRKPKIYFAGKIGKNDWRHRIVDPRCNYHWGLRGAVSAQGNDHDDLFDPAFTLDCLGFEYVGPFFIACDHGCAHGPTDHGVALTERGCVEVGGSLATRRKRIFDVNRARVLKADWVFAYIESADCYGTLIELGMAHAKGTPIGVGFASGIPASVRDDLWMAGQAARPGCVFSGSAERCWELFEHTALERRYAWAG
jgi:hypothetical protein